MLNQLYSSIDTNNQYNQVSVDEMIALNSSFKTKIELFTKRSLSTNTYDYVKSQFTYSTYTFTPMVYIPNILTADLNKKPVIAIGTDFAWPTDDYEDYIPGLEIDQNNALREIIISENEARETDVPLIIINFKSTDENSENVFQSQSNNSRTYQIPYAREYKITHRYENSNHSEYKYTEKFYMTDGTSLTDNELIKKIHKSQMNHLFTGGTVSINSEYNIYYTYLATFEYDWYASMQNIGVTGINGLQYLAARMKYPWEYYQRLVWDWRYDTPPFVSTSPEGIIKVNY